MPGLDDFNNELFVSSLRKFAKLSCLHSSYQGSLQMAKLIQKKAGAISLPVLPCKNYLVKLTYKVLAKDRFCVL